MGKKSIFKGVLRGTATTYLINNNFAIKLDELVEGIPEEFVVYPEFAGSMSPGAGFKMMGKIKRLVALCIKPGDKITIEGELILEDEGNIEYFRLAAKHIYNETLKCGF